MAYGSDIGLQNYLSLTGRSLPSEYSPSVAREFGSLYVNGFEDRYRGVAVSLPDSFPRDLWNPVPTPIEYATYEAGYAYASGVEIFSGGGASGSQVKMEKVDVLQQEFFGPQDGQSWWDANRYILPLAYQYLLPYMKPERGEGCCKGGPAAMIF